MQRGRAIDAIAMLSSGTGNAGTAIREAAAKGYTRCLQELIEAGAEVNQMDWENSSRTTPLSLAAKNGHAECVELLVKAGASVDAVDKSFWTPLMFAISGNHQECVKILIQAGADLDIPNDEYKTPVMKTLELKSSLPLLSLLRAGADVNITGRDKKTALMIAAQTAEDKFVQVLLASPAEIEKTDASGKSALIYAITRAETKVDIIRKLVLAGADWFVVFKTLRFIVENKANACCSFSPVVELLLSLEDRYHAPTDLLPKFSGHKDGSCTFYDNVFNGKVVTLADDPLILSHICRKFIRRHLLSLNTVSLFYRVARLGLPKKLCTFLMYRETLRELFD